MYAVNTPWLRGILIAAHARIQKIFSGGPNSRRGLTENFNMAKIDNLAIQGGGGGGGAPDPLPAPLDPPMAAYVWRIRSKSYVSTAYLTNDVCSTYERRIGAATHVAKT